jgi:hypothetical protein
MYKYYRNELNSNPKSQSGTKYSKIVEIIDFVSEQERLSLINFLDNENREWGNVAFDNSFGSRVDVVDESLLDYGLPSDFFISLKDKLYSAVTEIFESDVVHNTIHAQKWVKGGYANPHSDNSNEHGEPNGFEINKYVSILYLNDDYSGGEIYFPDHSIEFKPAAGSLVAFSGGIDNVHGVRVIADGVRHTIVSFWNFA